MSLTSPSGDIVYAKEAWGQDMRAVGLDAYPSRLRDLDEAIWERPFGRQVNYYVRRPRTRTILRELMNSEIADWGAARVAAPQEILQPNNGEGVSFEALQRWHFQEDFETYGMILPWVSLEILEFPAPEPFPFRLKMALFQNFPYIHEYQTWKLFPGARFKIDTGVASASFDEMRKLYIPFENRTQGRLIIPAGYYYLFIMVDDPPVDYKIRAYTCVARDYDNDTANVWRSNRYQIFSPEVDWDTYDYSEVVYQNDGSAPPSIPGVDPPTGYGPWAEINFSFLGRFV